MPSGMGLLSLLIWLPIAAGLLILIVGEGRAPLGRWIALIASVATLIACVPLYTGFDGASAAPQFPERFPWITAFHSDYYLGVDGISMPLILLTSFMTVPVVIAGWTVIEKRVSQYFASFLIMEGLMNGVFAAQDALLFYVFWEAMLIPMFIIIGVWGGPRRVYATIKFFLYTFLGSVFMLVALIYLYLQSGSYEIAAFQAQPLGLDGATPYLLRVPARVRREGADGAGAYLVAGRARRSADRRLGHPGRDHVEDGRLRLPAFQPADHA